MNLVDPLIHYCDHGLFSTRGGGGGGHSHGAGIQGGNKWKKTVVRTTIQLKREIHCMHSVLRCQQQQKNALPRFVPVVCVRECV